MIPFERVVPNYTLWEIEKNPSRRFGYLVVINFFDRLQNDHISRTACSGEPILPFSSVSA